MRKQWFAVAFCGFLMLMVGLLWSRVRELERVVEVLTSQRVSTSTVGWQNETSPSDNTKKKRIFKLIDAPPAAMRSSNVGVPWDVERAMIGGAGRNATPNPRITPEQAVVPDQQNSK